MDSGIRQGFVTASTSEQAVEHLFSQLFQPDLRLVLVFVSPSYDLAALAPALTRRFGDQVLVVGCTTAGEITPLGFQENSIVGLSLGGDDFAAALVPIEELETFNVGRGHDVVRQAVQEVARLSQVTRAQMFALTLIDGLSGSEEAVVSALHVALGEIPLFGASAGDCLRFSRTHVLHHGAFQSDCAVLVLVASRRPFRVFKTEHFVAGEQKMVVTEADPASRMVSEINAEPAAPEYARAVGLKVAELTPMIFATHPVVVRVGGQNFVRSIQKVNDDQSLTFFCAIDEGIVLTIAHSVDLADNLRTLFSTVRAELGPPSVILGFDCILRTLELRQRGELARVGQLMQENRVIGFCTYGEQYQAMHVNQTFTGVAIACAGEAAR